jgi:hypothetical protein
VVATEDHRQRAEAERFQTRVVESLANPGDFADVFLAIVGFVVEFRQRCLDVATIDDGPSKQRDLVTQSGDPER